MLARYLNDWIVDHVTDERYLFRMQDMRALCPELSDTAFKALVGRAAESGCLTRVCRGIYAHKKNAFASGRLLFHAAALLRANHFNYISLETVLSDAGVISQIPINWITIMSSGRSATITCNKFGTIEFIHTKRKPTEIMSQLLYDEKCRLWRATVPLALRDMKITQHNSDLIDEDIANEFI